MVDREKLIELLKEALAYIDISHLKISAVADWLIKRGVTVQKRGRWEKANNRCKSYQYQCSNCEKVAFYCGGGGVCGYNYCPNCGAKMDETKGETK